MAYEVIILYHLHMPLYFTGTFTEYLPFTDPTGLFMFMRISYSLERQIILLVCRGKVYRRSGSSIHGRKRSYHDTTEQLIVYVSVKMFYQ